MSNGIETAVMERATKETGEQTLIHNRFVVSEPEVREVVNLESLRILSDKVVKVDRPFAERFLDEEKHPRFEGERPYRARHAQDLMKAVLRKTYLPEHVILMSASVDGVEYRINGQHTCGTIISLDETHPGIFFEMRYIRYKAVNMAQMKALYASVDNGAPRTSSNKIVAQLAGEPGFEKFTHDLLRKLGEGLRFYVGETPHQRRALDPQVVATLLQTRYRSHSIFIGKLMGDAASDKIKHLKRSPVLASMFAAYESAKGHADIFFKGIRDGDNIKGAYNPILVARDYLKDTVIRDAGGPSMKKSATSEQMYRTMAQCWNAYRNGDEVRSRHAPLATKARPEFK